MAVQYTYLFSDLLTGAVLGDLPLTNVDVTCRYSDSGMMTAFFGPADPRLRSVNIDQMILPAKTMLHVFRENKIVWGGIVWGTDWQQSQHMIKITGRELPSYWDRRRIWQDQAFTTVDQIQVFESLIAWAQNQQNGNIRAIVQDNCNGNTGTFVTVTYFGYTKKVLGDALAELATSQAGFDYAFDYVEDGNGNILRFFNLAFPFRGQTIVNTGWLFEYPGNITDYTWTTDGLPMATSMWSLGKGTGATMVQGQYRDTSMLNLGYPLLEDANGYKDLTDVGHLNRIAQSDQFAVAQPIVTPVLTVDPAADPVLGSYSVGDEVRVRITDERFPIQPGSGLGAGIDTALRIAEIEIIPPTNAGQREQVKLSMVPTSSAGVSFYRLRDTFTRQVRQHERKIRTLEET